MNERCWICETVGTFQEEKLMDPRTGMWAHSRCVDRTLLGAMWRLRLSLRDLADAMTPAWIKRRTGR